MKKIAIHCFVSGRVQGVWFRAETQKEARRLGLSGWVHNLADGRVELLACGFEEQINQLKEWLSVGPSLANVENVSTDIIPWEEYGDFLVR